MYYLFFLFLLLELVGFLMLVNYNTYHQISYLSWVNELTGGINTRFSNATEYLDLEEKLATLSEENAMLREQLKESYLDVENHFNPYQDTTYHQNYIYRTAKIIDNELSKQDNYLMLNKGASSGIKPGMGVINSTGILGVVTDVSTHYSVVMSVLHSDFQLGVRLKTTNYFGILDWDGESPKYGILNNVQQFVEVNKGDTIQTLGASGIFPEGVNTGTVQSVKPMEESNTWRIKVLLSANIQQAKYVYVLENIFEEEVKELQEGTE
jgi:rod shape-determining protein MreC